MSETPKPQNHPFANSYPLPDDAIGFEFDLRDRYAKDHPERVALLNGVISNIQGVTGMNPQLYKFEGEALARAQREGLADENGMINLRPSVSRLQLYSAEEHTPEEVAAMAPEERTDMMRRQGDTVYGDMPAEAVKLLEDVYKLTGATLVRDDLADDEERGIIIRKGEYQGVPFYFTQYYNKNSGTENPPYQNFFVVNEKEGLKSLEELSLSEKDTFVEESGINPFEWVDVTVAHNVNRGNYHQIAHVLRQAKNVVDATIEE